MPFEYTRPGLCLCCATQVRGRKSGPTAGRGGPEPHHLRVPTAPVQALHGLHEELGRGQQGTVTMSPDVRALTRPHRQNSEKKKVNRLQENRKKRECFLSDVFALDLFG